MINDNHLGFLQSNDGTWSVVGPDGWPIEIRSYDKPEDMTRALGVPTIDVEAVTVTDTERSSDGLPQRTPFIGPPVAGFGQPAELVRLFARAVREWAGAYDADHHAYNVAEPPR
ncbi:hypothetical protein [Nocardia amamiensis]|uniref:hypothetical protein n=1 Tax=Nocardia amamiensis TaxID=404578 RepID=UPI000ADB361A|nr:hypothetical protein [Nocardia amamiensis]